MQKQLQKFKSTQLRPYNQSSQNNQKQQPSSQKSQQQYFDHNVNKKKKIIYWAYLLLLIIFTLVVLSLVSKSYDQVEIFIKTDSFYYANQVVNEWKTGFIKEVKVVSDVDCPAGYEHAFKYAWPGTGFGCYCQSSSNTTFVLEGYCSSALIQANCKNINSQPSRETYYWRNNSNICIKRSTVSFATQKKYDNTNKMCGSSQSLVVVPLSQGCPLVNISFSSFNLQTYTLTIEDISNILSPLFASYNSTSPYSFYSYPISKFSVSEYQFCLIDQDIGTNPQHNQFVLLSVPKGCIKESLRYNVVDKMQQIQFYNNNPVLGQLQLIKGFPQAGNWQYKLGFKSYPSWTYRCRHNLNNKFSISIASQQLNFTYYQSFISYSIIIIISCCILFLQFLILILRRFLNNHIYPIGYRKIYLPDYFYWQMSRYVIDFICKLLILIFIIIIGVNGYLDWIWYKQVLNYKCYHDNLEIIHNIILPYKQIHWQIMQNALILLLITLIIIVIDGIHFKYIYSYQLKYYLINSSDNQLINTQQPNKLDSLEKLNDLKWLENQQEIQQINKNDDDLLRITMAKFVNDEQDPFNANYKVNKLKKKKKKKINNINNNNINNNDNINNDNHKYPNPYSLDDDLFNIDNEINNEINNKGEVKKKNINRKRK